MTRASKLIHFSMLYNLLRPCVFWVDTPLCAAEAPDEKLKINKLGTQFITLSFYTQTFRVDDIWGNQTKLKILTQITANLEYVDKGA